MSTWTESLRKAEKGAQVEEKEIGTIQVMGCCCSAVCSGAAGKWTDGNDRESPKCPDAKRIGQRGGAGK